MRKITVATFSGCLTQTNQALLIDVRKQGARKTSGMTIEPVSDSYPCGS